MFLILSITLIAAFADQHFYKSKTPTFGKFLFILNCIQLNQSTEIAPLHQPLLWFSPIRNLRRLLFSPSHEDDLACVHGMRVVTMVWIIIGHTLDWNRMNSFRDSFTIHGRLTELIYQPLYRGLLTVDSFFFLR